MTPADIQFNNTICLLTESQAADFLQVSSRTLQSWRYLGHGPQYVKISARSVRYRYDTLAKWCEERVRSSTSDKSAGLQQKKPDKKAKRPSPLVVRKRFTGNIKKIA